MRFEIIDKDTKPGHTFIDIFDLKATVDVPEFESYFRMRKRNPELKKAQFKKKFGEIVEHFEIAFRLNDEMESKNEDTHPFYNCSDEEL